MHRRRSPEHTNMCSYRQGPLPDKKKIGAATHWWPLFLVAIQKYRKILMALAGACLVCIHAERKARHHHWDKYVRSRDQPLFSSFFPSFLSSILLCRCLEYYEAAALFVCKGGKIINFCQCVGSLEHGCSLGMMPRPHHPFLWLRDEKEEKISRHRAMKKEKGAKWKIAKGCAERWDTLDVKLAAIKVLLIRYLHVVSQKALVMSNGKLIKKIW